MIASPRSAGSTRISAILFDYGGVLVDNAQRHEEWKRYVGEYLAPRLGGTREQWAAANGVVAPAQARRWLAARDAWRTPGDEDAWWRSERPRWLAEMCEHVGIPVPDGAARIAEEAMEWVGSRALGGVIGVADAVRALHARGIALRTASGNASRVLDDALTRLGVRDLFGARLYGPDQAGTSKNGPEFYARIVELESLVAAETLVVDDSEDSLEWARAAGLRGHLVTRAGDLAPLLSSIG